MALVCFILPLLYTSILGSPVNTPFEVYGPPPEGSLGPVYRERPPLVLAVFPPPQHNQEDRPSHVPGGEISPVGVQVPDVVPPFAPSQHVSSPHVPKQNVVRPLIPEQDFPHILPSQKLFPNVPGQEVGPHVIGQDVDVPHNHEEFPHVPVQEVFPSHIVPNHEVAPDVPSHEVPHVPNHEVVPHVPNHEEVPHVPNHEVVPHVPSHENVPHVPSHEVVPHVPSHENVPHVPSHEVVPHVPNHNVAPPENQPQVVSIRDESGQYSFGVNQPGPEGQVVKEQGRLITTNDGWEYVIAKKGSYSYTSPEGVPVKVEWEADHNGFRILKSTV